MSGISVDDTIHLVTYYRHGLGLAFLAHPAPIPVRPAEVDARGNATAVAAAEEQLRAEEIRLEYGESTPFDVLLREE